MAHYRMRSRLPRTKSVSPRRPHNVVSPTTINAQLGQKPQGQRLDNSDDSDGLVTKGNGGRRGGYLPPQEVFASGALGSKDKPNVHPTRAQRRKQMENAGNAPKKLQSSQTSSLTDPEEGSASATMLPKSTAPAVQPPQPQLAPVARPAPLREDSVLNGIRPRKRQHSILRSPGLEDSTLGSSLLLPEDQNSPLNLPAQTEAAGTPPSQLRSSVSKKRKLDTSDVPVAPEASSPPRQRPAPVEPASKSLPRLTSSTLKRRKTANHDHTDIMAPPMSSSDELSSPPKAQQKDSKKKSKPTPTRLTTQQLQAQLMPNAGRKLPRNRKKNGAEFDIPSDTDSAVQHEEDDSTFLTSTKQKSTRRRTTTTANTSKKINPTRRKASGTSTVKPRQPKKNSTAPPSLLLSPQQPRNSAITDAPAKSPSQLSTSTSVKSPPLLQRAKGRSRGTRAASRYAAVTKSRQGKAQVELAGGSRQGLSSGKVTTVEEDKENSASLSEPDEHEGAASEIEVQVGRGLERQLDDDMSLPSPPKKKLGGKWGAIDDFEMDFEEVSWGSESASDPAVR